MKKTLLLSAALLAATFSMKAQFNTSGAAIYNSASGVMDMVPGAPCGGHVNGAAWNNLTTVDFTRSFILDYDARFTTYRGQNSGADGIVVVFGNNINTAAGGTVGGTGGGHMGYYYTPGPDFNNSIGIEFDIFDNGAGGPLNDIPQNHVMIAQNASAVAPNILAPAVSIDPGGLSVEDATYHHYRIEWDCEEGRLRVYFDYNITPRIDIPFVPASVFSAPASVRWGFTAARHSFCSEHHIRRVVLHQSDLCINCMTAELDLHWGDCNDLGGRTIGMTPLSNPDPGVVVGSYVIDFGDGSSTSIPGAFPVSILHDYAPGTYKITFTAVGYNERTGECCREVITIYITIPECSADGGGDGAAPQLKQAPAGMGGIMIDNFRVHPNPTSGDVRLDLPSGTYNSVVVTDVTGREVYRKSGSLQNKSTINLGSLSGGSYIITIQGENGIQYKNKVVLNK